MAWLGGRDRDASMAGAPVLAIEGLDVYYGRAHAIRRARPRKTCSTAAG